MRTEGVDLEWVRDQLVAFVRRTEPINQSSAGYLTSHTAPSCGRREAIELVEIVRPILARLYPMWSSENEIDPYDEFAAERDAAERLLARLRTADEVASHLGGDDESPRISAASLHPLIWSSAQAQWATGHRHEAVLAAAKAANSLLQTKVGRRDVSEGNLVRQAFTDRPPEKGKARLRFDRIEDDQSRESMREGVMQFGSGCFAAIRNPVGHLPNDQVEIDEQSALERLAALSLFARWLDEASVHAIT